jgi:hypothetical protein
VDAAFTVVAYVCGLGAAALIFTMAVLILAAPKTARKFERLFTRYFIVAPDRAQRRLLYRGGWSPVERLLPRRGRFFYPRDVDLSTPETMYQDMLRERELTPGLLTFYRLWAIAALGLGGACLIGFALHLFDVT